MKRFLAATVIFLLAVSGQIQAGGPPVIGINGGSCAFPSIITAVAAAPDQSTIFLSPGDYVSVLPVVSKSLTFVPAQAGSDCQTEDMLADRGEYSINPGAQSRGDTGGLFELDNGAHVIFRNMTLRGTTAINGGVIAITDGAQLTLDGAIVEDGVASADGGNIYAVGAAGSPSEVRLVNGAWVRAGVSSTNGGGIALFASALNIDNGRVGGLQQTQRNVAGERGGGVYALQSVINVTSSGSRINGNASFGSGAGIHAVETSVSINDATINQNSALVFGGGINISDGNLSLTNVTMSENSASSGPEGTAGGAIFLRSSSATISASELSNNLARSGGGIYVDSDSDVQIESATELRLNTADQNGAGIWVAGLLSVRDTDFSFNIAGTVGGGIYCFECNWTQFRDVSLTDNRAIQGGGLAILGGEDVPPIDYVITDSEFVANLASTTQLSPASLGGGLYAVNGRLLVSGSAFESNRVTNTVAGTASGGGIYHLADVPGALLTIQESTFTNNETNAPNVDDVVVGGGALYVRNRFGTTTISRSLFAGNTTSRAGGAVLMSSTNLIATNINVVDNIAGQQGGGFYLSSSTANISSDFQTCGRSPVFPNAYCSQIDRNSARSGAAITLNVDGPFGADSALHLDGVAIRENVVTGVGGSATISIRDDNSEAHLSNVLIAQNSGINAMTAISAAGDGRLTIRSTSIVDNRGAPIQTEPSNGSLVVENSLIYFNDLGTDVNTGNVEVLCNNSQDGSGVSLGENLGSPNFSSNTALGDYHLSEFSTSVDRCASGPARDLDGLFRSGAGAAFDQGAFEFGGAQLLPDAMFADGFEDAP